jgi:putative membrane protein
MMIFGVFLIGCAIVVYGQTPPTDENIAKETKDKMSTMEHTLSMTDKHFTAEAAIGGMTEVKLGELAQKTAQSDDVKAFGERMVKDHGAANDELKAWATEKKVVLPAKLDMMHQSVITKLSKLSGDAFDKAYMTEMVKDHVKDVAKFKDASTNCQDPDLKAWATKTLPTLEEHLTQAKTVAQKVGVDVNQVEQAASSMKETH